MALSLFLPCSLAKIKQAPKAARETVYKDNNLAEAYSYDGQGNRVEENNVLIGVSRTYTHDDEDKIVWAVADPEPVEGGLDAYTYDVDGFLTSRSIASGAYSGAATFDYSSRGELLSATLPDATVISYDHDPMGRRIAKRINGTIIEKYLWQDATTLLAVLDAAGTVVKRFEYADGRMPVSMTSGGQVYYLAYDQVGSLRVVTDVAGAEVKRVDYDSFGNILSDSNPTFSVPFGFAGGLHDRDTGLVRFGARDYDPATGKWTAKDPIDFAGGDLNLISYVGQNPINWVDVSGTEILNPDGYPISPEVKGALEAFNYFIGPEKNITITGGNRPPDTKIGKGKTSTHVRGIAADIKVEGQSHLQTAIQAEEWGYFGGVGWYEEGYYNPVTKAGPHVHVDLRRNGPARWGFDRFGNDYHRFIPKQFISAASAEADPCP